MTSPGPKKSGFLAKLQNMAVIPLPVDDGQPIVRPRGVTIASVLAIVAGVIFLLGGALGFATAPSLLDSAVKQYNAGISSCEQTFGGHGSTLATPTVASLTSSAAVCRSSTDLTQSDKDGFLKSQRTFGVIFVVIGLVVGAAGWFLRNGARWAKRTLVIGGALLLLAAALLKLSTPITLVATLLMAIAVVMTYVGKNAAFFMRVAMRGKQH
ncbi:hypothetical protein SAMN04515671_2458 [Nakamurella panacisegetis]|uniref:DUF7144 domain-containing protein n=1 Tax=Nakamurella panacisegetis TaxID=1090615 RepID=A0A1H0NRC6_9ACTN|nr:hypothetical protein [Nakamurella panacisegetis]SDO95254.1 hypothetical protein SAMN04515671_2458 [Nakamurella panacisegetis]